MKKALNTILIALLTLTVIGILAGAVYVAVGYFKDDGALPETDTRRLHAEGNAIKNETGETVVLKAINAGGLFIQEGWMSPTLLSAEPGVGVPDHVSMLETLRSRFGYERAKALTDIYEASFWGEADFDNVKELGFNAIRLPFAYFNLENEEGELTEFAALDRFIDECDKRDIYVIPDLHGAYGSQNGNDHSGSVEGSFLFTDEENMSKTVKLWETVAARYRDRDIIAGYDLLNEPKPLNPKDNPWPEMAQHLVEVIREVDPDTPIIVEWFLTLPFAVYGKNIIYSFHFYDPWEYTHSQVSFAHSFTNLCYPGAIDGLWWDKEQLRNVLRPYLEFQKQNRARIFIGEFSVAAWAPGGAQYLQDCVDLFEEYGWDWTYHAFREWSGWSVEHAGKSRKDNRRVGDTDRKRVLLKAFEKNQK